MDTFRVPADSQFIQAQQQATQSFTKQAQELRDSGKTADQIRQLMGPPHAHGYNALIKVLQRKVAADQASTDVINLHFAVTTGGWEQLVEQVRHSQVSRMYDSQFKKPEVSVDGTRWIHQAPSPVLVYSLLARELLKEGAVFLGGAAPKGDLERQLQGFLDQQKQLRDNAA